MENGKVEPPNLVSGLINAIINQLFSQSPILIGDIVGRFTEDLAKNELLFQNDDLRRKDFIQEHYLNHLSDAQKFELMLTLFAFVFNKSDEEIDKRRIINMKALIDIINTHYSIY